MRGLQVITLACALTTLASAQGPAPKKAQRKQKPPELEKVDRRDRRQPELVLDTGGRTGTCDVLRFTADGKYLLAAGDDKIVRVWEVDGDRLKAPADPTPSALRWSVWREQRGAIYAMDILGDEVAIAGMGLLNAPTVVVLDRRNGNVLHALDNFDDDDRFTSNTVRAVALSPSGNKVAFGTADGRAWIWDVRAKPGTIAYTSIYLAGEADGRLKPWRLLHFEAEDRLLGVCEHNGEVVRWDLSGWKFRPKAPPPRSQRLEPFKFPVYVAALSPNGKWLAVAAKDTSRVDVRPVDGKIPRTVPGIRKTEHRFCLAFAPSAEKGKDPPELVVGIGGTAEGDQLEGDDRIVRFDLTGGKITEKQTLPHSYRSDAVAFHPSGKLLAVAGGDNHEVRLFRRPAPANRGDFVADPIVTVGEGRGLWDVALSADGRLMGFKNKRHKTSRHPNRRGDGDWQVFDLKDRKPVDDPGKFVPQPRLDTSPDGWSIGFRVDPDPREINRWAVVNKRLGQRHMLKEFDQRREGLPRCYAFIPADRRADIPTRLLIGHDQGAISLYELREKEVKRARVYVSGQGEVTALAVAKRGEWFVSTSSDQTISAWSLKPFPGPNHPELGARFVVRGDKVVIPNKGITLYSPAWEAGLVEGDELAFVGLGGQTVVYDPNGWFSEGHADLNKARRECVEELSKKVQPARNTEFYVYRKGHNKPFSMQTTVRQRPLWRFFPASQREWALWMWQQPFYVCSDNADKWLGPQLNHPKTIGGKPSLYPMERFQPIFNDYDVIDKLLETRDVRQALLTQKEAPDLVQRAAARLEGSTVTFEDLFLVGARGRVPVPRTRSLEKELVQLDFENLALTLLVDQRTDAPVLEEVPHRVELWVNDHRVGGWETGGGKVYRNNVTLGNRLFRIGKNRVTFQCYNRITGRDGEVRAERELEVVVSRKRERPQLHALLVGVAKYAKDSALAEQPLEYPSKDAKDLHDILKNGNNGLYQQGLVRLYPQQQVSKKNILGYLEELRKRQGLSPDDLLVVFLAGHGDSRPPKEGAHAEFYYCCHDFDDKKLGATSVSARDLFEALAKLPCRKCLLLDTCRSGAMVSSPVRNLTPGGIGPTILAACDHTQKSLEPVPGKTRYENGLFTQAVREALSTHFASADADRDGRIDELELYNYVYNRMPGLLQDVKQREGAQVPTLSPRKLMEPHPIISRPVSGKASH